MGSAGAGAARPVRVILGRALPGPTMWGRRDEERVLKAREQLRFRLYAAIRDVALGTELFRANFQLHEPEISISVYSHHVDVNASLSESQLRLVATDGRPRVLTRFAEQLRSGMERAAITLQLELSEQPGRFGVSEPILVGEVPVGYHAVLLRPSPG